MKIVVAVGTRPEAIKLAPVVHALRGRAEAVVCTTGQHPELAATALRSMGIDRFIALGASNYGTALNLLSAHIFEQFDTVLEAQRPDWVLVQGDTTSAWAAGVTAFNRCIRLGHVEAGLRTQNLASPFPEEANRAMLGRIATLNFAPTPGAVQNLLDENTDRRKIILSGNTIVDAVARIRTQNAEARFAQLRSQWELPPGPMVLISSHRRENLGDILEGFCAAVLELAAAYAHVNWVFVLHPNARVQDVVRANLGHVANVFLLAPLPYADMLCAVEMSALVVTDSGGLQEEIACLRKPAVVLRDHTERPEGIAAGFATLAGRTPQGIGQAVRDWLDNPDRQKALATKPNPYGPGDAATRIVDALLAHEDAPI